MDIFPQSGDFILCTDPYILCTKKKQIYKHINTFIGISFTFVESVTPSPRDLSCGFRAV